MAYATVADVDLLNAARPPYSATSNPTAERVVEWLEQTAAEINGILKAAGHDPSSLDQQATVGPVLVLRKYNAIGAWASAEKAAPNDARAKEACEAWESAKNALRAGELDLDLPTNDDSRIRYATAEPIFRVNDEMRGLVVDRVPMPGDGYTHNDF